MKKKFKFIYSVLVLLLILLCLSINSCKTIANNVINTIRPDVLVKNETIKTLSEDNNFIGANWQVDFFQNQDIFSNPEHIKAFAKALNETGVDLIRYPGGQDVATYFWDVPNETIIPALKKWKNSDKKVFVYSYLKPSDRIDFASFLKFCKQAKIKATVQVNTHTFFDKNTNTVIPLKTYSLRDSEGERIYSSGKVNYSLVKKAADAAAAQVKWVKDNGYSDIVKYWELGNEEFIRGVGTNSVYSGTEYGQIAAEFIKKMKQADPSIKFILTNQMKQPSQGEKPVYLNAAFMNDWSSEVLNFTGLKSQPSSIFAVAYHIYSSGKTLNDTSFQAFYDNALNNTAFNITENLKFHKKNLENLGYKNTSIFVNEFNANSFKSSYSHTWIGALGNARIMLTGANTPSCYHMDYFNILHGYWIINDIYANKGFGMLHYAKDFQTPFIIHPVGNVIKLLNENIKGKVLNTCVNKPDIVVTSTEEGNDLHVIILNRDTQKNISLKFNGFSGITYLKNKSLGINVPADFTCLDSGDSSSNPSEVRLLNFLENAVNVSSNNGIYEITLPKNTLSVFIFKKNG